MGKMLRIHILDISSIIQLNHNLMMSIRALMRQTRKSVHRTQMPPPKCHSEKGYTCSQGQVIHKPNKQELSSMFITHCLNVMHASVKFHKYIPYGLGVMAWTQIGMDVCTGRTNRGNT